MRQLRLVATVAIGVALIVTAVRIIVRIPDEATPTTVVVEQKPQPRYIKNPAGGTPLSTAENPVLQTTPIADLPPPDTPPTAVVAPITPPPTTPPVATVPAVEDVVPTPKPRPPKREKPKPIDAEADNATFADEVAPPPPKQMTRRKQREEEFPAEMPQSPQEPPVVVAKPAKAPVQRVDNPWDTPTDSGFNQK